jgi:aminopeptidase N
MLRDVMGEPAFRRGLRTYYERNRLRHVREADLLAALETHHPAGLGWFFHQWLHTTARLDFSVGRLEARPRTGGGWDVGIEIRRAGDIWMPVTVQVDGQRYRLDSLERQQWLWLQLPARPLEVVIDPDRILVETDIANNTRRF